MPELPELEPAAGLSRFGQLGQFRLRTSAYDLPNVRRMSRFSGAQLTLTEQPTHSTVPLRKVAM